MFFTTNEKAKDPTINIDGSHASEHDIESVSHIVEEDVFVEEKDLKCARSLFRGDLSLY